MSNLNDDEIVRMVVDGNVGAFDLLVERYAKHLFNFIYRMVRNEHDAEDILQEVFMRVVKGLDKYRMEGKFKSWIFTIANRLAISKIRERSRKVVLFSDRDFGSCDEANVIDMTPDESSEPGKLAENRELGEKIEAAIESLPLQQKQVFLMRHGTDLSFREISEILNIPLNTALGRMHYAIKNMRRKLLETCPGGECGL